MKSLNVFLLISILMSMVFQVLSYKELTNNKIQFTFKRILFLLFIFVFIVLNNLYDTDVFKAPLNFLLIMLANKALYQDPFGVIINTTTFSYVIVVVTEIILSMIFIKIGKFDLEYLNNNYLLIFLFTFVTNFVSYINCRYLRFMKKLVSKLNKLSFYNSYKIFILCIFLFSLLIIDFRNVYTPSFMSYIVSVLLVILIFIIFVSYINDEFRIKNELKKVEILLDNISNYEKVIDNNRINSHEMLNNLVLLKSFKNKNTKKYEKLLNDMIIMYDKTGNTIKNISLLPHGIKGIIYFKTNELHNVGIDVNINISKQVANIIEKINHDEYVILCKIIPILLDNAVDACMNENDKILLIEIYKQKDNIVINIENSCSNKVDVTLLGKKYNSTKGNNRGLGLYIVNNLLSRSKCIELKQESHDKFFVSKIIIKK